jgi:hypothetical protein
MCNHRRTGDTISGFAVCRIWEWGRKWECYADQAEKAFFRGFTGIKSQVKHLIPNQRLDPLQPCFSQRAATTH